MAAKKDLVAPRFARSVITEKRDFSQTPEPSGRKEKPRARPAAQGCASSCRCIARRGCITISAWRPTACWPRGRSRRARRSSRATGASRCTSRIIRIDYRDFEGNIPAGQYGAGSVIVWDRGTYALAEGDDPAAEIANGKIKFVLHGKKLHGEFTLVKIKAARRTRRRAVAADQGSRRVRRSKVRSRGASRSRSRAARRSPTSRRDPRAPTWQSKPSARHATAAPPARRASKRDPLPHPKALDAGDAVDEPFDDPEWLFEIKWDGYRALCTIDDGKLYARLAQRPRHARALSGSGRTGRPRSPAFPSSSTARSSASTRKDARRFSACKNRRRSRPALPTSPSTCSTPTARICARSRSRNAKRCSSD